MDNKNYNIRHTKFHYIFKEQEVLEVINQANTDLGEGNDAQKRRYQEAYHAQKAKDTTAYGILINAINGT